MNSFRIPGFNLDQPLERQKFTIDEDNLIKDLVGKFGIKAWGKISLQLPGRTARQCRERYVYYLQPHLVNGPWTEEEEQLLIQKFQQYGSKWAKIATFFESRSDVNLKNHWAAMKRRKIVNENVLKSNLHYSQNSPIENSHVYSPPSIIQIDLPKSDNSSTFDIFGNFQEINEHGLPNLIFDWENEYFC